MLTNYTCEVNPPLPSNLTAPIFNNCCSNDNLSLNSTQVLTNFSCQSESSSKDLGSCITSHSHSNTACNLSSSSSSTSQEDDMNSSPHSRAQPIGWKITLTASLLLLASSFGAVSASPTTPVPDVKHVDGSSIAVERIGANMFMAQASCSQVNQGDCYSSVYDVCTDQGCNQGCNCVIISYDLDSPFGGGEDLCHNPPSGSYQCSPFVNGGTSGPLYIKMDPYAVPNADIVITRDQICPPSGPNAVVASVHHDKGCVYVGYPEPSWGVSSYVNGGSPYKRSAVPDTLVPAASQLEKRSDCTLDVESQVDTYSTSVIISETVDCRGKTSACSITIGKQHTESVESSWSLSSGFDDFGFSVSASFGMSYTQSDTSTKQESITVEPGQEGYLTYYVESTRFTGTFRGCDQDGQQGTVYALKSSPAATHYAVVNTNR